MYAARLYKFDTTLTELSHSGQHIGRTQSDALQGFVVLDIQHAGFRLDQLNIKA